VMSVQWDSASQLLHTLDSRTVVYVVKVGRWDEPAKSAGQVIGIQRAGSIGESRKQREVEEVGRRAR